MSPISPNFLGIGTFGISSLLLKDHETSLFLSTPSFWNEIFGFNNRRLVQLGRLLAEYKYKVGLTGPIWRLKNRWRNLDSFIVTSYWHEF